MKTKLLLLVALFAIFFASCAKEEEPAPTTGSLTIKARLYNSTGYLSGVDVGLATSQYNLDNMIYLFDKVTDSNGEANFGQLNAANYYYDGYTQIGSTAYYGEGQVQVVAGEDKVLTLIIHP